MSWVLLIATLVVAVTDWVAVSVGNRRIEYAAKPATMVVLVGLALSIDTLDGSMRVLIVVGLLCSLAGDVFLMLPRDMFVLGLVSFLLGHIAYIAGLATVHESWASTLIGLAVVLAALAVIAPRIVAGVRRGQPEMLAPVVVYMAVISAMVVTAWGTTRVFAVLGATSFYVSDSVLAWARFVRDHPWSRLAVMITYHLGQLGLVLSLVR